MKASYILGVIAGLLGITAINADPNLRGAIDHLKSDLEKDPNAEVPPAIVDQVHEIKDNLVRAEIRESAVMEFAAIDRNLQASRTDPVEMESEVEIESEHERDLRAKVPSSLTESSTIPPDDLAAFTLTDFLRVIGISEKELDQKFIHNPQFKTNDGFELLQGYCIIAVAADGSVFGISTQNVFPAAIENGAPIIGPDGKPMLKAGNPGMGVMFASEPDGTIKQNMLLSYAEMKSKIFYFTNTNENGWASHGIGSGLPVHTRVTTHTKVIAPVKLYKSPGMVTIERQFDKKSLKSWIPIELPVGSPSSLGKPQLKAG